MKTKYTNGIVDFFQSSRVNRTCWHMWGAETPIPMGDGIRFRVTKSPIVDYVYVRYDGMDAYEVEFGALANGTEYDVLDRVKGVTAENLVSTISRKVFGFNVVQATS